MKILNISIRKVLMTNATPTVEIEIETEKGTVMSSAPVGTSRGKYEAHQISADDAVRRFALIKRFFLSREFQSQKELDKGIREVDPSTHFRDIGGNLAIAISFAFLKAFALESGKSVWEYVAKEFGTKPKVPLPLCNVVGGWKGQNEFQEFLFLPIRQTSFRESLFRMNEAYNKIGKILEEKDPSFRNGKNMESAWVTSLGYDEILDIMKKVGDEMNLRIGLDVAASQFFKDGFYHYRGGVKMNPHEQFGFIESVVKKYPVSYVEDPFQEDDWLSLSTAVHRWQPRMVCGDDFYATRIHRLLSGVDRKASNAAIVKPNQVGTVTESAEFAIEASKHGIITVLSHRSGETYDNIISHIAVGLGCDYVKFGIAGDRIAKVNEILRIEDQMLREASEQHSKVFGMSKGLLEKVKRS